MKSRIKHIVEGQRGFTLIELLVAVAITGVIVIGLSIAVFQLVAGNAKNNNHMTAVRQVQQVGHWMSQDMQMANFVYYYYDPETTEDPDTYATEDGTDVLIIYWTEYTVWSEGETRSIKHKVTYNLTDDNRLIRHHYNNLDPDENDPDYDPTDGWLHTDIWPDVGGFPTLVDTYQVAQYIDLDSFEIIPSGSQYALTVTATVGGFQEVSEIRTYDIDRRPNA